MSLATSLALGRSVIRVVRHAGRSHQLSAEVVIKQNVRPNFGQRSRFDARHLNTLTFHEDHGAALHTRRDQLAQANRPAGIVKAAEELKYSPDSPNFEVFDPWVGWKQKVVKYGPIKANKPFTTEFIDALLERAQELRLYRHRKNSTTFTPTEDRKLLELISSYMQEKRIHVDDFTDKEWLAICKECLPHKEPKSRYAIRRWDHLQPGSVFGPWTDGEDQLLMAAAAKHDHVWAAVARDVPGRSEKQCYERYWWTLRPGIKKGQYSEEESRIILESVDKYTDHFRWSRIAALLPGRTALSVKHHYERKLMPSLKKGPFTPEEKKLVQDLVQTHGEGNWWAVAQGMNHTRSCKSLQWHWQAMMKNRQKVGDRWTRADDMALAEGIARAKMSLRGQWRDVADRVENRIFHQCQHRWRTLLKRTGNDVRPDALNILVKDRDMKSYDEVLAACMDVVEQYHKRMRLQVQVFRERRQTLMLANKNERNLRTLRLSASAAVKSLLSKIQMMEEIRERRQRLRIEQEKKRARLTISRVHTRLLSRRNELSTVRERPMWERERRMRQKKAADTMAGLSRNITILSDKLAAVDPQSEYAYYYLINRGLSYEKMGRHVDALHDYESASQIKTDATSILYRGQIKRHLGDIDAALQDLNAGLQLYPNDRRLRQALKETKGAKSKADNLRELEERLAEISAVTAEEHNDQHVVDQC